MTKFNRFGVTASDVADMFVTGGANDTASDILSDLGGESTVNNTIDDIVEEVTAMMCSSVYNQLNRVRLEEVTREGGADEGTTVLTAGVSPVSSTTNLDVFKFGYRPDQKPERHGNGWMDPDDGDYTASISGGELTLTFTNSNELGDGYVVYLSYDLDTDSTDYTESAIAAIVKLGAAATLGPRLYTPGDAIGWQLVEFYRTDYRGTKEEHGKLALISDCSYVPTFYRHLRFWEEIELDDGRIYSVPIFRS